MTQRVPDSPGFEFPGTDDSAARGVQSGDSFSVGA